MSCTLYHHGLVQTPGSLLDQATFIVVPISLPVGLEPAALIDVEKRTPDLHEFQSFIESTGSQFERIQLLNFFGSSRISWHQARCNQFSSKTSGAAGSVPHFAHTALLPTVQGQGGSGNCPTSGLTTILEKTNTSVQKP